MGCTEKAYPSTFLIDRQGVIFFNQIFNWHSAVLRPPKFSTLYQSRTFELTLNGVDLRLALASLLHAGHRRIPVCYGACTHKVFIMTPQMHARKLFLEPYQQLDCALPLVASIPFLELIAEWLLLVGYLRRPAAISLGFLRLPRDACTLQMRPDRARLAVSSRYGKNCRLHT
jgi:hypothetical protein